MTIEKQIGKENMVYTYNKILVLKGKKILPFVTTWMDLEGMLSGISWSQEDTYCMILFT